MHKAQWVLLLLMLSFSLQSLGAWVGVEIYQATKEACQKVATEWIEKNHINLDLLYAGRFPSQPYTQLLNDISQESRNFFMLRMDPSLPATAKAVLREPLFEKALLECYPDSETARNFFRQSVRRASHSGKFQAAVWGVAMFYGVNTAIQFTARWSVSLYQTLFRLNWSLRSLTMLSLLTSDTHQESVMNYRDLFPEERPNTEALQAELLQSTNVLVEFHKKRIQQLQNRLQENPTPEQEAQIQHEIKRSEILIEEALALQAQP